MSLRIKGLETSLTITENGAPLAAFADIRNHEVTLKFEKKKEDYLGQASPQYDEVWDGCDGRLEIHMATADYLKFFRDVKSRAQRQTPGTVFNLQTTLNFPSGDSPTVSLRNIFFGPMPMNISGRTEYISFSVDYSCSDVSFINL